jgi:hypothetical protein
MTIDAAIISLSVQQCFNFAVFFPEQTQSGFFLDLDV